MKEQTPLVYTVLGVLVGGVIVWVMSMNAVNSGSQKMMDMMGMRQTAQSCPMVSDRADHAMMGHDMNSMSMEDMTSELEERWGDEFDKAFIEMMISHHQGAIDMAEHAIKNAEHQQIKDLAKEIIEAQKEEIDMMKQWQEDWGY